LKQSSPFVVLGAGPAGLTAGRELAGQGLGVTLIEADPVSVGGISRTVERGGFRFDIGGHRFFTKAHEVQRIWKEILGEDFLERPRKSRILYRGKFFAYPLEPWDALVKLGPMAACQCVTSWLVAQARPIQPEESYRDWVSNRFGRRLFETFFQTYTEKVWGLKCEDISADWAAQRIRNLSLVTALTDAFLRPTTASAKSLIRTFHYPRLGPGQLWERAAAQIRERGGSIHMGRTVRRIEREGMRVTHVAGTSADGSWSEAGGAFISTIPLRDLIEGMSPAAPDEVLRAAGCLRYRDFLTVCLIVEHPQLFDDTWLYVHDPAVRVGRVQNFKNWSPDLVPDASKTSLGMEYFCFEGDGLWNAADEDLAALAESEARSIGLIPADTRVFHAEVVRMPKAYPVYDKAYAHSVRVVREWLKTFENLMPAGRNGLHRYNNQDHSMLTGLSAARSLAQGTDEDVWTVNSDAEYLEEHAKNRPHSANT